MYVCMYVCVTVNVCVRVYVRVCACVRARVCTRALRHPLNVQAMPLRESQRLRQQAARRRYSEHWSAFASLKAIVNIGMTEADVIY